MSKLKEIKDQIALERGLKSGNGLMKVASCRYMADDIDRLVDEVARRYATAVADDVRKRAAEQNKDLAVDAYESITSLEIELI